MNRRTLLQWVATVATTWRFPWPGPPAGTPALRWKRVGAQPPALSEANVSTLHAIAEIVLPTALGADGRDAVVRKFVAWHLNYREGAEAGHGYGTTRLRTTGPPPASRYPDQFAALDVAARARGFASLSALAPADRRAVIETALETPQRVTQLPAQPTGANVVADLMGFFFSSADGYDLGYQAAIGRDQCRSLAGSEHAPAVLASRGGR